MGDERVLVIRIAESIEDFDTVRRIAALLHFQHLEETIAFLMEGPADEPYHQYESRLGEFISGIRA